MAYKIPMAKHLLDNNEMELYRASLPSTLSILGENELKNLIKRTREFRNKSSEKHRRQVVKIQENTGMKKGMSNRANKRSILKTEVLSTILERFEKRLAEIS
jgi:hypothetical protein